MVKRQKTRLRGVVEMELLLGLLVLITLVLMVWGSVRLGLVRLQGGQVAGFHVLQDSTAAGAPALAPDGALDPVVGFSDVKPGLPNRMHVAHERTGVQFFMGNRTVPKVTIGNTAAMGGPMWMYCAYPVSGDQAATDNWFTEQSVETEFPVVWSSLVLSPAWPP